MLDSEEFQDSLIKWYGHHGRDLPWRKTNNPYHIWICEIILQQTRVNQGMPYYYRIIERFPDIYSLAQAPLEEVLKLWQGLGYYSRARNLHNAAIYIVNELDGRIPADYNQLLKIKGIGKYTAGAIASMAFNLPYAAIDGNVYRVLSRLFNDFTPIDISISYKYYETKIKKIFDSSHPSLFNQAIIELGALICLPAKPLCRNCPVKSHCEAFLNDTILQLPVKNKIKSIKNRYLYYFVFSDNQQIIFHRRTENDIWKFLYDFPAIESDKEIEKPLEILKNTEIFENFLKKIDIKEITVSPPVKHLLTHQILHILFIKVRLNRIPGNKLNKNTYSELDSIFQEPNNTIVAEMLDNSSELYCAVQMKDIFNLPVPKVIASYLKKEFDINE
jgi:A/G-specific adenine glycosylase